MDMSVVVDCRVLLDRGRGSWQTSANCLQRQAPGLLTAMDVSKAKRQMDRSGDAQ
jgi:hypothetical protein